MRYKYAHLTTPGSFISAMRYSGCPVGGSTSSVNSGLYRKKGNENGKGHPGKILGKSDFDTGAIPGKRAHALMILCTCTSLRLIPVSMFIGTQIKQINSLLE